MGGKVVLHLASAEELVCGSQIAAFHLVEYGLCVNESALREVEVDACTQKFLSKHRYVEVVGIVSCEVAVLHFLVQFRGNFLECRGILHVVIADAGQFGHLLRNGLAWIYEHVLASFLAVWHNLNI